MSDFEAAVRNLVIANRILANEGVVDAWGHVSIRHPDNPGRFLLSRSRSPEFVIRDDILEFTLDGKLADDKQDKPYIERFIHGAIYEARPDVNAVVHSHALDVLPFTISSVPLRPVVHMSADMGNEVPVWDIQDKFGDTSLLVMNNEHGRDLAACLGKANIALMRGHGFAAAARTLHEVVQTSVYVPQNARVLMDAVRLGGSVKYLSPGEVEAKRTAASKGGRDPGRIWDYWTRRVGGDAL